MTSICGRRVLLREVLSAPFDSIAAYPTSAESRLYRVTGPLAGVASWRWQNTNNGHHAIVLVAQDMAVINEIADIGATEIHAHSDAGIGSRAGPIRHLDHIKELSVGRVDRHIVSLQQLEMDLVKVELMMFGGAVLDCPILDRTLMSGDRRRSIGVEQHRLRPIDCDVEVCRAGRVVWI